MNRDGTSQSLRRPAALDPGHAPVDERSTTELLAFARAYGEELVYYDAADRPDGDWGALLDPEVDLDALGRAVDDPDSPIPGRVRRALRPHATLFLAYVGLLGRARDQLNTLTRRHLDFYYRTVLGLSPRAPVPDRAHVVVRLARGVDRALLPAGTLLDGGKDSRGKDRIYRIDRDFAVSRAEVARLSSVHVEREVITLQRAREDSGGDHDAALLAMLSLALGDPAPGDPLPAYKGAKQVDMALLSELHAFTRFAEEALFMELHELSAIVRLLAGRADEDAEWEEINGYLQGAMRVRLGDPTIAFLPADPTDFDKNLDTAVGGMPTLAVLPEIVAVEDLYYQRDRQDVRDFITLALYFPNVDDFARMMQVKLRRDDAWREVNRILERCGRKKRGDETYRLSPADPAAFEQNLDAAVGPVDWSRIGVASVDAYHAELVEIERAFFMPAEDFAFMMAVHDAGGPTAEAWDRVADLLAEAHARKVDAARRQRLKEIGQGAGSAVEGLSAALLDVLGQEHAGEDVLALIERLRDIVPGASDIAFLRTAAIGALSTGTIADATWDSIALILERAKRVMEGFRPPVPRKVTWLDIQAYPDATSVIANLGIEADRNNPRWKPFGEARPCTDPERPPAPALGWSVSSPLLALQEGRRTIVLTLGLDPDGFDTDRIEAALEGRPFAVAISTAEGFVEAAPVTLLQGDYQALSGVRRALPAPLPALQLTIELGEDKEPVVAPPPEGGAAPGWPVLRLLLRPVWDAARGRFITPYEAFKGLVLAAAHIRVEARGLRALALENDRSILNAGKPFEPFGASPAVGSRFYVGHPELCDKALDSLALHIEWMQAPADLAVHYAAYGAAPDFTARIALQDRRRETDLVAAAPLFASTGARDPHAIVIADVPAALQANGAAYPYEPIPGAGGAGRAVSAWRRQLVWELSPLDFQHTAYPRIAAQKAGELTAAIALSAQSGTPVDVGAYQVPPPYTPILKRLSADYTASVEVRLDTSAEAGLERVQHIHPFGACAAAPSGDPEPPMSTRAPLFPRYDEHAGELYLGLRDFAAPGIVALLFQLAEGSADPDLAPAEVSWSCLEGDRWVSLGEGGVLSDGTRGLQRTGIVELSLDRTEPGTRMPGGLTWLRAAVREGTGSVCDVVAVHAQAAAATFVDHDNAQDHYEVPLPPGSIAKLRAPVRGIAAVLQPYASFGGRGAERDEAFTTRAGERLRHKQRALTVWDYEHLVLERFPEIYRAKCLPAGASRGAAEAISGAGEPGQVTVIVIPDIKNRIPFDPFEPKAPAATIAEIAGYLADKSPPFARIEVKNAFFIPVQVRLQVRFMPGADDGLSKKRLSEEICRFLSPWAYDEGADITLGNRIYANSIVDFVDRRPYVDFVAGITLLRREGHDFIEVPRLETGGYHVSADRPDAVLVAARSHEIDTDWQYRVELPPELLTGTGAPAVQGQLGIGHMIVSVDFVIGGPASPPPSPPIPGAGLESMKIEIDFKVF